MSGGWHEECGIFAAAGVPNAAEVVVLGLHALQHRGQESTGLVSCDDEGGFHVHKGLGLVADVYRGLEPDVRVGLGLLATAPSLDRELAVERNRKRTAPASNPVQAIRPRGKHPPPGGKRRHGPAAARIICGQSTAA